MRIHFIIHESFEAPGAFLTWAQSRGHQITYSHVYANEPLPSSPYKFDMLVVMGGPQSPATTMQECPHFDAKAEINFIKACIRARRAILGICLGSQLIGEAYGAPYEHSPEPEIGCYPITLSKEGKKNPLFSHFGETLLVGHWHNDMPGLTENSMLIASSQGCPRQIVQYDTYVYGFQCHMELNQILIEALIHHSEVSFQEVSTRPFIQLPEILREQSFEDMNLKLYIFLDHFSELYTHDRYICQTKC